MAFARLSHRAIEMAMARSFLGTPAPRANRRCANIRHSLSSEQRRPLGFETLESRRVLSAPVGLQIEGEDFGTASRVSSDWFSDVLPTVASSNLPALDKKIETISSRGSGVQLQVISGEWIVQLSDTALEGIDSVADAADLFLQNDVGLQVVKGLGRVGEILVRTTGGQSTDSISWLTDNSLVDFFEPNAVVSATVTPNDPHYTNLWGLHNTGQTHNPGEHGGTSDADIDAPEAWDITTGDADVIVALLDTGVDYGHPDLGPNIWTNTLEVEGTPGVDDDGNGMIDDVHGWDFYNGDNDPMDDNYHGTHVAGTIAAAGNNNVGVIGVSWTAAIMPIKIWGGDGRGSLAETVAGVNYVSMMRREHGIDVRAINFSGGNYPFKESYEETSSFRLAIEEAGNEGILFVAAACNNGVDNDIAPAYPGSYTLDNIIAVAATNHDDVLARFSSFGLVSIDLAAPGVDVLSTFPTYETAAMQARGHSTNYQRLSGTSMATAHVTGTAALLWALKPNATYVQVSNAIRDNVDAISGLHGKLASGGRLNAHAALQSFQPSADFDDDDDVDGFDFLIWHRGYGTPMPNATHPDGDADYDRDVDADDLTVWEGGFGTASEPIVSGAMAILETAIVSSSTTEIAEFLVEPLANELVDAAIAMDAALRPERERRAAGTTQLRQIRSDAVARWRQSLTWSTTRAGADEIYHDGFSMVDRGRLYLDTDAVNEELLDKLFAEAGMPAQANWPPRFPVPHTPTLGKAFG